MAEQINYNQLYEALTPLEQQQYAGYKIARNLVPSERKTQDYAFPDFKEILDAEAAAASTKPSMWNPMNWLFPPAASAELEDMSGIAATSAGQQYFDYYNQYGDNYSNLKIPGSNWRQRLMNQKIQQQKKMIGMPQHLTHTPQTPTPTPTPAYTGPQTQSFNPQQFAKAGRRADKPGGFTDPGEGSYGPHKAYGGRVSYFDGGLASLWLR